MAQKQTVNVTAVIDESRFGGFQWAVTIWCAILVTFDGFDNGAIGFVAPAVVKEWHASMPSFGPVFGAGLFGLMLGALASGPLADRFGRKIVVMTSTLIFSGFALATVLAHSVDEMYALRFLTGVGVGGLMPNSIALTAEYAPKRIRVTVVAIMFLGFPLGAGGGGFIGAALIPAYGWRAMFLLGGIVPLVLLPFAYLSLPESIRYLALHGHRPEQAARLLNRLVGKRAFTGSENFVASEEKRLHGFSPKHLLTEGRALNTVLLWITFFSNLLIIYSLNSWLPLVLHDTGVPIAAALRIAGLISWGGIASTLILGPVVDRLGAPGVVTALYCLASICIFAIGLAGANVPILTVAVAACGMCVIGGQSFINVMSAVLYPTGVRSTGVGWALGVGRVGAIVGPVVGGLLLGAHMTPQHLFFTISVPALVAALAMLILGLRLRAASAPAASEIAMAAH